MIAIIFDILMSFNTFDTFNTLITVDTFDTFDRVSTVVLDRNIHSY